MNHAEHLTVKVKCNIDSAVYDMFDIAQSLDFLVSLVPDENKFHARAVKRKITGRMADWLNAQEK